MPSHAVTRRYMPLQAARIAELEKLLASSRRALKTHQEAAEKSAEQARADREVLAECVRQMASQLATANAAKETSHSKFVASHDESMQRLRSAEISADEKVCQGNGT